MLVESRYNVWATAGDGVYVHNGISGRTTRLSGHQHRTLTAILGGAEPREVDRPWLEELVTVRALLSDAVDELEVLRRRYGRSREDPRQLALTIVTSLGCNFDCPYCYEDKHPSLLRPDVEDALVRLVEDRSSGLDSLHVTWFGGEPLLGMRALRSLSQRFIGRCDATDVSYSADVVTNGSLLTEAICRELRALRVTSAQITIDGPPGVHDRRRPRAGGGATFWEIVDNLHHAADHLDVTVRVNLDRENLAGIDELLAILAHRGLAGRIDIAPAPLVFDTSYDPAPAGSFRGDRFTTAEFAQVEREFRAHAVRHGFAGERLPAPTATPCIAVQVNGWVVGSEGELWKCWDSVGDASEAVGTIFDVERSDTRVHKWLTYDPFSDPECSTCVALPGCMGGCAHHAMADSLRDHRCGTFRYNHQARVDSLARWQEFGIPDEVDPVHLAAARAGSDRRSGPASPPETPVMLLPTRRRQGRRDSRAFAGP